MFNVILLMDRYISFFKKRKLVLDPFQCSNRSFKSEFSISLKCEEFFKHLHYSIFQKIICEFIAL